MGFCLFHQDPFCLEGVSGVGSNVQDPLGEAIHAVIMERSRQMNLWGDQSHHPLSVWTAILGEEYGELCEACLETELDGRHPERGGLDKVRKEAVQVAAVAVALVQATFIKETE